MRTNIEISDIDEIEELGAEGQQSDVAEEPYAPYPFDADKISISERKLPLYSVAKRLERGLICTADIQRSGSLWNEGQQSRLIESILLKIPLPFFYVAADRDDRLFIVDGLQRINTIRRFMLDESLKLHELEFLEEYEGKIFSELPEEMKIRIYETDLNFIVINPDSPPSVQRNIFKRLNTGGLPLTDQEIRHALYFGLSTKLLKELAHSEAFKKATGGKVNDSRMAGQDLVLRYLAFSLFGIENFKPDDTMDSFLSAAMQAINMIKKGESIKRTEESTKKDIRNSNLSRIEEGFFMAMERAGQLFGECAFRVSTPLTISSGRRKKAPINKSLFEVWSLTLAGMSASDFKQLMKLKDVLYERLDDVFLNIDRASERRSISRDSGTISGVKIRHNTIKNIVKELIGRQSK